MAGAYYHPAALVESEQIGPGTRVWAFAHVMRGARVGENCNLGDHAFVESGAVIGDNVTIKNNVCVWDGVTLENDVFVGPNVAFTNDRFPRSPRMPQVRERYAQTDHWLLPTVVERGATIGANATVLPGIRLGRYCMVAAGAVVAADVPPFALVVGTPARQIGDICRCGRRLAESYRTDTCTHCGETPEARCQLFPLETITV
jgi:UDP-2-acetamido-3-amino-2,3-dideoxy-glucuronate N-acetyltransferase